MGRFCILGAGYVGQALADALRPDHDLLLVRRHWDECPPDGLTRDLHDMTPDDIPDGCDAVYWTASPDGADASSYERLYVDALQHVLRKCQEKDQPPLRFFLTTSTAVYHQNHGEVVDENSPTEPTSINGQILCEAEALLKASPLNTVSLRLAGIYGPGRYYLLKPLLENRPCLTDSRTVLNMIHRDDVVGAMVWLAGVRALANTYNVVDTKPTDRQEVFTWLSKSIGIPLNETMLSSDDLRRATNKICSNARLRQTGYHWLYPDYRAGYADAVSMHRSS